MAVNSFICPSRIIEQRLPVYWHACTLFRAPMARLEDVQIFSLNISPKSIHDLLVCISVAVKQADMLDVMKSYPWKYLYHLPNLELHN